MIYIELEVSFVSELLKKAYDAKQFAEIGHQLIELLTDYLQDVQQGVDRTLPINDPEELYKSFKNRINNNDQPIDIYKEILEDSIHIHNPFYIGHQVTPVAPLAALTDLLSSLLNNGMGIYEMGAVGTAVERVVLELLAKQIGFTNNAGGILTSGGSLGNLTALLTARKIQCAKKNLRQDQWRVLVSEDCHYCVSRVLMLMGCNEKQIITMPVDNYGRIDIGQLPDFYHSIADKQTIIAVVATAGTTATGSYDPIDELADFCHSQQLWLHVDAAHGGAVVFSDQYKHLVNGIEKADSMVMDFHKLLLVPALTTAVIYRQHEHAYYTFEQEAHYLFTEQEDHEWYNIGKRTFECTKYLMGLRFYVLYRYYGKQLFSDYINQVYSRAKQAAQIINNHDDFELLLQPSSNIICFRYYADNLTNNQLDELNQLIRAQLLKDGPFYIVQTRWRNKYWLRVTWMNVLTELSHWHALIERISVAASTIIRAQFNNC